MTREVLIRRETGSDHRDVERIQEAAFGRAAEARLVSQLRESAQPQLSLVASHQGRVVGHIFLSPVTIEGDPPATACAGLAPVGVEPRLQRNGIGSALIREALRRCPEIGWSCVFLLGDPAYYARFGFVLAAPRGFHYENEFFDSAFQLLELEPGCLAGCRGWVRYHDAFAEL